MSGRSICVYLQHGTSMSWNFQTLVYIRACRFCTYRACIY